MDILQRKYLEERLRKAVNDHENKFHRPIEPKRIKRAKKIIERWDSFFYRTQRRYNARIAKARRKITKVILFGDDAIKALKALKEFEAKKF